MRAMIALLLVVFSPFIAAAADPVIGNRVFVKEGADAKDGEAVVEIKRIPFPATVEAVDGESLWLERAWVRKSDVMSADEALASYGETVKQEPTNVSAWRSRAFVWLEKSQPDKALEDCTKAIKLNPNDAASYVARGLTWILKEEFEKSVKDCTNAIKLDPNDANGYRVRGAAWLCTGSLDNSIKDFTEAIRRDPGDTASYSMRASLWSEKGTFGEAIADDTEIIRLDPKNVRAFRDRGHLWERTGEFGKALKDYTETSRLDPKSAVACNNIARLLSSCPDDRIRDGKKAVEYATKACELRRREFWGDLGWLAAAYAETGDFTNAVKWGEMSLKIAPEYARNDFAERLELYRANKPCRDMYLPTHRGSERIEFASPGGDWPRGSPAYKPRRNMNPKPFVAPPAVRHPDPVVGDEVFVKEGAEAKDGDSKVGIEKIPFRATVEDVDGELLWLGRVWVRKSDVMSTEEALKFFNEQIQQEPTKASAWRCRGCVWEAQGEHKNAILDYTDAIRLDPKDAISYCNRGRAWITERKYDIAIQDLTEAIRLDSQYAPAYYIRGLAWMSKGESDNAINDCTDAIRLDSESALAYEARGVVWRLKGELDNAIKDFTEASKVDPKYSNAFMQRASTWEQKDEIGNALKDYAESVRLNPKDADCCHEIAWIRATSADERYRDGKQAVEYATKACVITGWKRPQYLDTLAVAHAEAGDFTNAIKWEEKSLELSPTNEKKGRLELFWANKPYRRTPKK